MELRSPVPGVSRRIGKLKPAPAKGASLEAEALTAPAGRKTRLILRFGEIVEPPLAGEEEEWFRKQLPDSTVNRAGVLVRSLFASLKSEKLKFLARRARRRDRRLELEKVDADLRSYIALDCPAAIDALALAKAFLDLGKVRVPLVYEELGNGFSFLDSQKDIVARLDGRYRDRSPLGIDAKYASQFPGGDGAGLRFVDVERGWNLDHLDLIDAGITVISGEPSQEEKNHGTAVLGIVAAVDNGTGVVGIVPGLTSARVVAVQRAQAIESIADAILSAITELRFGDVLLIEMEITNGTSGNRPVEVERAAFDAIRVAAALGIVVIEPAGNGGKKLENGKDHGDLDHVTIEERETKRFRLQRGHSDFRDSGAILVGAARKDPHTRHPFSNFGSRVDCYAWGEDIATTLDTSEAFKLLNSVEPERLWGGFLGAGESALVSLKALEDIEPPLNLPDNFGHFDGTSGASAIIAGVALAVQGLVQARLGFRFSPWQLRHILSDPENGTPSEDGKGFPIGVMPDLRKIINRVLRLPGSNARKDSLANASVEGTPSEGSLLLPDPGLPVEEVNGHVVLPFTVSGSPDRPREMWVEVISRLPRRTRVWLEMPPALADLEGIWGDPLVKMMAADNVYVPVNPNGSHPFREAILPKDAREKLRLVVRIPPKLRKKNCCIAVRLLHDLRKREEVGRTTWLIGP